MTALRPAQFVTALAKPLPPAVLLAGEEPLLIQEALDAVRAAARQQGYGERRGFIVEPGFRWQQVFDEYASLSLFAAQRVIEVHMPKGPNGHKRAKGESGADDADHGKAEDGAKALVALMEKPARDVLLVVTTCALDKRGRESAWYQALDAAGLSLYAWPVKPEELPAFIEQRAKAAGLKLDAEAVQALADRTEGNLLACAQDIDKLALLFPNQAIGAEALMQAVADSSRFEAFDLIDKMLVGDAPAALHTLTRLREEGVSALELVGALAYALRQWSAALNAFAKTRDLNTALAQARLFGVRAKPYEAALQRGRGFSPAAGLVRLATVDQAVKTGHEAYAWEELLALVLAASGAAFPAARAA
jgi:DNA polymerase III subunit delta